MRHLIRIIAFLLIFACISFASAESVERLDDKILLSFYDDSVFFGDSRLQGFKHYVDAVKQEDETFFAKTKIIGAGSISLQAASKNAPLGNFQFSYAGRQLSMYGIAQKLAEKGPLRGVFIIVGLNDPIAAKPDKGIGYIEDIITRMKKFVPGTEIYFFSETPVTVNFATEKARPEYQDQLDAYNPRLKETCEKNGAHYIEIAEALKGADNMLRLDYSNDKVCHLNENGIAVWIQCMKDYAQEQYELGLWDPFAEEPAD
ncbi:MAG: hypothetical protein IKG23_01475 [Clostridia bacterium]|nr:hypothetical protein [Clostridia bacterium]